MKKMTAIFLSLSMIFSLAACGEQGREETTPASRTAGESTEAKTETETEAETETETETKTEAETEIETEAEGENTAQSSGQPEQMTDSGGGVDLAAGTGSGNGKTLVVYFSATGHTDAVAGYIAGALDGDLFRLEPVNPYSSDDLDWRDADSRVSQEHDNPEARNVELKEVTVADWDSYSNIFIGYPIWWGIAAWPVDGFIEANDFTGKTVVPFCTSASSDMGESGQLLAEAAGTGNWLEGRRFSSGASQAEVQEWADSLELQTDAGQP